MFASVYGFVTTTNINFVVKKVEFIHVYFWSHLADFVGHLNGALSCFFLLSC